MHFKALHVIFLPLILSATSMAFAAGKPEVVIDPSGLSPEVLKSVDDAISAVVRLADDQDGGEAERIRSRGRDAVVSALATQGYFAPKVTLEVGEDVGGETWDIYIEPGKVSTVASVENRFSGSIAGAQYAQRVDALKKNWGLPVGSDFINARWSASKSVLLDGVKDRDFYLARMTHSQAVVNPETSLVDTVTEVNSGPAVKLGNIEVIGLRRVPESLVRRYVRYKPGDPYSQDQLDEWQQALQSTNFFRGAFVSLKTPEGSEIYDMEQVELPVSVRVTEGPASSVVGSLGVDDMSGIRVEGLYKQNVVWGLPVIMETGAGVDFDSQRAFLDFTLPPNYDGSRDSVGVVARHSKIQHEEVTRFGLGWKRKREFKLDPESRVNYESNWGVLLAYDSIKRENEARYSLPNVVGTWDLLRSDLNDRYAPRDGNLIVLGLGAGMTLNKRQTFGRVGLRVQQWWPVGKRDVFTLRAEAGQVLGSKNTPIPDDFGYRTGGPRSIRGYKYNEFGRDTGNAIVGTRSLAVVGAQYMHYFNDRFGMSVFVDAGDAAPSFREMKIAVGYGVGAIVNTPAGPLSLDLAWGQRDRKLRLHFSLGVAF
ncbi:autotransporter assembly complex protein TamA [Advenella sp. RU8]|uniref:autotransporter assembly complex protein TamA n=1 Tax=Advenella sp. RU8 TaxID=3399575 RepID=UPI003AAAC304